MPGHPENKIFKAPDIYPVKGFDVSSAEGVIDWGKVAGTDPPRFMYARWLAVAGLIPRSPSAWPRYAVTH